MPTDAPEFDDDFSIRGEYERLGPDAFYRRHGADYRNPHEPIIADVLAFAVKAWKPDLSNVLDLAAGSGEVSLVLKSLGAATIDGVDPFTYRAYERRVGKPAERYTFDEIAAGSLLGRRYSLIVCSFAMHLCDSSRLPRLAMQLAFLSAQLWILTPHKRPVIEESWGWRLAGEKVIDRVRIRAYSSTMAASS